jgi:hypothetical protein
MNAFTTNRNDPALSDITAELGYLRKAADVEDELKMLLHLLHEQRKVVEKFQLEYQNCRCDIPTRHRINRINRDTLNRISEFEEEMKKMLGDAEYTKSTVSSMMHW